MKILLAAATAAEVGPVLDHFGVSHAPANGQIITTPQHSIKIGITGGGMIPSTFALTKMLSTERFDFVLQAGIGGAFDPQIPLGSIVAVHSEQLGDTGAEDHDQFIDIFELGFADKNQFPFKDGRLVNPMQSIPFTLPETQVAGLTVSTVSGHAPTISSRSMRYQPAVESMEGASLHYVCLQLGVPFLQVRAISNYVTPRDRSSWQIGKAVKALNDQLFAWFSSENAPI